MDLALCTGALSCWNRKRPSPKCSTESSRMSYAVALRFPFTGTKGKSPNHEKQPQTIIPPIIFTVGTMHSGRCRSPGICQNQMVNCDLSLQRTRVHCSRVQWRVALHHSSRQSYACGRLLGHGNPFHEALHEQFLCWRCFQGDFGTRYWVLQLRTGISTSLEHFFLHTSLPFCELVWPTTLQLCRCCS
jgi:hypothetical protein